MKTNRMVAFRLVALLMLTALAITSTVPAGASPAWDWIPGTVHYHCIEPSNRTTTICTWPTDNETKGTISFYGCQQSYDLVFSEPVGGLVDITVPKDSYNSDPFFEKTIGPNYLWLQVYLTDDGNGTVATTSGALYDVDISITVTGNGTGGFDTDIEYSGGSAPAGSCLLYMPLNMSVWLGTSETDPTEILHLFEMEFPMWVTTGFIEASIIEARAYAFPNKTQGEVYHPPPDNYTASLSMDGYSLNATGVPFDAETGAVLLAGAGAGLDIQADVPLIGDAFTDYVFVDFEVAKQEFPPVGGVWIPVDKLALLAPYIGLASTIILAVAATAIFFKYRKKP